MIVSFAGILGFVSAPALGSQRLAASASLAGVPRQFTGTVVPQPGPAGVSVGVGGSEPAPMGVADFGLGPNGPYQYSTNESMGEVNIDSLQTSNSTGDRRMAFQLNVNLAFTSNNAPRDYWIQDWVQVDTSTNEFFFLNNVWNQSSRTAEMSEPGISGNGQIYTYQNGNTYYAFRANSFGISLAYPATLTFLVMTQVDQSGQPTVTFEYSTGSGLNSYDTVTFDTVNQLSSFKGFYVDGFDYNPWGSYYDSELIMGGQCCGYKTEDVSSNVGMILYYWNGHNFETVPNTYNFGGDTAEGISNVKSLAYHYFAGGTNFAYIIAGSGSLGNLYSETENAVIDVRTSVQTGTLDIVNSTTPSLFAQYPFVGGEVVADVYPGTFVLQIYRNGAIYDQTTATVSGGETLQLQTPFNDVKVTMSYSVLGGGTGFFPVLKYVNGGTQLEVGLKSTPTVYFMDPGSVWSVTANKTGNNERWITQQPASGTVTSNQTLMFTYYHQYQVTFGYSVSGGGTPGGAPTVQFSSFGSSDSTPVGAPVWIDAGSNYTATNPLSGSSSSERWVTYATSSAVDTGGTVSILYYHQFPLTVSYTLIGGGSPPESPAIVGSQLGTRLAVIISPQGGVFWFDSGSTWAISQMLGEGSQGRWLSPGAMTGVVSGAATVSDSFYHQYSVTISYSIIGGGSPTGPSVSGEFFGAPYNASVGQIPTPYYFDSGSTWTVTNTLGGSSSAERWALTQPDSGPVPAPSALELTYYHQYYVTANIMPTGGGSASNATGWYTAGTMVQLSATASSGWQFEGWTGSGQGAYSGQDPQSSFQAEGPVVEDATFYPGLVITAGSNGAVSYSFGSQSGTVQAGTSQTVYTSPGSIVDLSASPSSVFFEFGGWTPPSPLGNSGQTSVILESPSTAAASFSLNFLTIGGIVAAIIAVGATVLFLRRRGSRYPSLTTQPQPPAVCPSCGAPTNPALAFCENCGARLRQT